LWWKALAKTLSYYVKVITKDFKVSLEL